MIINFLELFLKYSVFFLYFYLVGNSFITILDKKYNLNTENFLFLRSGYLSPLIGMILISNFLFLINTFLGLATGIVYILLFLFIIPSLFKSIKFIKSKNYINFLKFGFYYLLIPSILLISTFDINFNYDAGYYHLLHQNWLRESNLIIGMVNIFWAFGMSSIYEYISAILWFDNSFVLLHFLNIFFIHFFYIFISENLFENKRKYLFNASFFVLIYSLLDNFGIGGGRNGFIYIQGITKQDVTVGILFFFIAIVCFQKIKDNSVTKYELFFISLISLFIYQIKVSGVLIFLIYIALIMNEYANKRYSFKEIVTINSPFLIIGTLWSIKNLFTTGCLIFPLKITCITSFSWYLSGSTEIYESITKNSSLAFNWSESFLDWVQNSGAFEYRNQIYTNFLVSIVILLLVKVIFFEKEKPDKKLLFLMLSFLLINFTYLLFFGPIPRYAIGATLTSVGVIGFLSSDVKLNLKKNHIYLIIFLSIFFLVRADSYIAFWNNNDFRFFDPRSNYKINVEIGFEQRYENWVKPLDQDQCWSNLACTMTEYDIALEENGIFTTAFKK